MATTTIKNGTWAATIQPGETATFSTSQKYVDKDISVYAAEATGFLPLSGGTMTGILTLSGNQMTDDYSGALNANNSNIYGVNSLIFADLCETAKEGIQFYADETHVDSLLSKNGVLWYAPNRELGTNGTTYKVLHEGNAPAIYSGTSAPSASLGKDGDLYIKLV